MCFYVKLESKVGHVFLTDRNAAFESDTIRDLVLYSKEENPSVSLPMLSMKALLKIVSWCEMYCIQSRNFEEEIESEPEGEGAFIEKRMRLSQWEFDFFQGLSKKMLFQLFDAGRLLQLYNLETALGKFVKYIWHKRQHQKIAELPWLQETKSQFDQFEDVPDNQEDEKSNGIMALLNTPNAVDDGVAPREEEKCPMPEKEENQEEEEEEVENLCEENKQQIVSCDETKISVEDEIANESSFITLLAAFIKESVTYNDEFNDSIWAPTELDSIEETVADVRGQGQSDIRNSPRVDDTFENLPHLNEHIVSDGPNHESQILDELLQQDKEFSNMQLDDKTWNQMNDNIIRTRKWGSSKVKAIPIEFTDLDLYFGRKNRDLCPTPVQVLSNNDCPESTCPTKEANPELVVSKQDVGSKHLRLYERGQRKTTSSCDTAPNDVSVTAVNHEKIQKQMEKFQGPTDVTSTDESIVPVNNKKIRNHMENCQTPIYDASTEESSSSVNREKIRKRMEKFQISNDDDSIDEPIALVNRECQASNLEQIREWVEQCLAEKEQFADETSLLDPWGEQIDEMPGRMYQSDGAEFSLENQADMKYMPNGYIYDLENMLLQNYEPMINPPPGFHPHADFIMANTPDMKYMPNGYIYDLENIFRHNHQAMTVPPPGFSPHADFIMGMYEMPTVLPYFPSLLNDYSDSVQPTPSTASPEFLQSLIEYHMENDGIYRPEYFYPEPSDPMGYQHFMPEHFSNLYD